MWGPHLWCQHWFSHINYTCDAWSAWLSAWVALRCYENFKRHVNCPRAGSMQIFLIFLPVLCHFFPMSNIMAIILVFYLHWIFPHCSNSQLYFITTLIFWAAWMLQPCLMSPRISKCPSPFPGQLETHSLQAGVCLSLNYPLRSPGSASMPYLLWAASVPKHQSWCSAEGMGRAG